MTEQFFDKPILNSPYAYPARHWELDPDGLPTNRIIERRRSADFITPIPKPKRRKQAGAQQLDLLFGSGFAEDGDGQRYNPTQFIQGVREQVDQWRRLPNPESWRVTPETARLLQHWRSHNFQSIRPFFCQIEAVETAVWLTEVAPQLGKRGDAFWDHIRSANEQANPDLLRVAFKLATGAGKTMVMAMIIAWQTINAVRHPTSTRFARGFLIVTPGITIKDRLRVLQPNDPDSYYARRELVPSDMLDDLGRAKIVITNYHAFKLRERLNISSGGRKLLQGRGPELNTLETEGQMLQRVMPDLMGLKNILVINDEAHHCYREKPGNEDLDELKRGR
jgi:type III restriction enzyme